MKTAMQALRTNEYKWSQWNESGLFRCGTAPLKHIMNWMNEFAKEARAYQLKTDADHVVYGKKIYNDDGTINEIRFYCKAVTDAELDTIIVTNPLSHLYVVHKR